MSEFAFKCSDKTPWPRQFTEWFIWFTVPEGKDFCHGEAWQHAADMTAGAKAGGFHFEPETRSGESALEMV